MQNAESALAVPADKEVDKLSAKRVIDRRCPICDRGHRCFTTAADLDTEIMESSQSISIGSTYRLQQDVIGSWRGVKTLIPDGTKVKIVNLHTEKAGGIRAMVELPDGDAEWIPASLLGSPIT